MTALIERMIDVLNREGITAKQVTIEFGASNSSFSDWKKGKGTPSINFLSKFSKRFDVSIDYLVFGECSKDSILENSSILTEKFNSLTEKQQQKVLGYIDGLISSELDCQGD